MSYCSTLPKRRLVLCYVMYADSSSAFFFSFASVGTISRIYTFNKPPPFFSHTLTPSSPPRPLVHILMLWRILGLYMCVTHTANINHSLRSKQRKETFPLLLSSPFPSSSKKNFCPPSTFSNIWFLVHPQKKKKPFPSFSFAPSQICS